MSDPVSCFLFHDFFSSVGSRLNGVAPWLSIFLTFLELVLFFVLVYDFHQSKQLTKGAFDIDNTRSYDTPTEREFRF